MAGGSHRSIYSTQVFFCIALSQLWRENALVRNYLPVLIHSFVHLFRKYLLNPSYMLVTLQVIEDYSSKKVSLLMDLIFYQRKRLLLTSFL